MKKIEGPRPQAPGPVPQAENSLAVRLTVLAAVLIAVGAVGVYEEFTTQALLAGMVIAAGNWMSYRRRYARNTLLKVAVALLVILVARDFFYALVANPYDPRIALVRLFLWLQALHSLDLPRRRDLKYSLISAIVLIAVGAAYARDLVFGFWLISFAVAGSVALATMQLADINAARVRSMLRMGFALAAAALMFATVLFLAVPRAEGYRTRGLPVSPWLARQIQFQGRIVNPAYPEALVGEPGEAPPVFNPTGYVGFSTYVDLRLRGVLTHDLVMRVRASQPAFWRGLAFDEYTGRGWRMSDPKVTEFQAVGGRIPLRFDSEEPWPAGSEQVIQTFYIEAAQPNVVFGAYRAAEVYFPSSGIDVDRYVGLRSAIPLEQGIVYSVISRVPSPAPALLRLRAQHVPPGIAGRYLRLPAIPLRISQLARNVTAGLPTAYDKAIAVNRFLTRGYSYTLQAPLLPNGADAVDDFLFESRRGSCEAFASAMVVLLRAAGVPARLVTGYTTGTYNLLTGFYEVYNSDAHAWVEVYVPRAGWIEFEPTPGFASPDEVVRKPGQWLAADVASWAAGGAQRAWGQVAAGAQALWALAARGMDPSYGAVALLALAVVLLRRRGQTPQNGLMGAGEEIYVRMLRVLARAGFARAPTQTPSEFADTLPEPLRTRARVITGIFEQWRYGGQSPTTAQQGPLAAVLDELRRDLRRRRAPGSAA